jgi:myosin heavy subunit
VVYVCAPLRVYVPSLSCIALACSRDNQGCLDLIEMKRTGVMAMIEEEIYVPKGSDHTMVEKMHTQNFGYNDFYAKPVVRGGRAAAGSALTPQDGFIIKHYAGPVPYKVDGFLDKCKDRLPSDSEELLKNSTNSLIAGFFKDAQGWSDAKGGGRPATLGGKFKDSMQELYTMLSATSPHFIKCVKPNNVKRKVFDSNFTLYQLTYLGLLEVIRIRKSGYPVRVPHDEFVGRYRLLEENPNHWPSSTDICRDHGTDGDWQIGATMVFMRDMMYSHLETSRARMLDKRIRGLQGWMREELKRRTWTTKKKGFVSLQARQRGSAARKRVARLRLEVDCERKCEEGVSQRKLEPLEYAIGEAERISHTFPLLAEARAILDRLKDEKEVEEMLAYAVEAKDSAELERSLQAATQLGLEALWHGLNDDDPRKGLIPRCQTLIEQLSRYDELMAGLNTAMRERTVEALKAMIIECESVELECGEVEEAREMLKMAEFEQSARRLRMEKRQRQIEAQWTKPNEKEAAASSTEPNVALLEEQANMERRIREFEHALTAATENGEAFPGELQRLEAKIAECKQQLQSDAMKAEERRQRIEREKAELELAKREAARNAEVRMLCAAMVPGIRIAMGTYRAENLEAIVTKVTARLGSEASSSLELGLAQDVLNEMKVAKKHATEAEVAPLLNVAIDTGKAMTGKTHAVKIKALVVALSMALSSGVHSAAATQAKQLAVDVLDAWQMTAMLNHATLLGRKTMLATVLQRAHENEGFSKYAGTEGREAMGRALQRVKEDEIDVSSVPAAPKKLNDLAVRTQGGQVVVHFLDGRTETFANRISLQEAIDTIVAKHKLARAGDYGIYQTTRVGTGERLLSCGGGEQLTLGQVCQDWLAQAAHYAELMGSKLKGDASALGDAKFNYRFFFLRKLIFGDSLSNGNPGDTDELYWYSRKRVENGACRHTVLQRSAVQEALLTRPVLCCAASYCPS